MFTEDCDSNKASNSLSATTDEINAHSEKVLRHQDQCLVRICPKCQARPDFFTSHDKKQRKFRVIIEQVVHIVIGLLTLWKCSECGRCFMGYPAFAMPYKRYTVATIHTFCQRYVEEDTMTYRKLIAQTPVLYPNSAQSELQHSTIHRWVRTLGQMNQTVAKAQDFVLQANPASTICRDLAGLTIPARKYVSETRQILLLTCRRLIEVERRFLALFHVSIFHQLATTCGYG